MTDTAENEEQQALAVSLQAARRSAGLSQETVAGGVGIPCSALSDIERGCRSVSAFELAALATVLGVDIETLLSGEPDTRTHTSVQVPAELTFAERREVTAFAEFLVHRRHQHPSP